MEPVFATIDNLHLAVVRREERLVKLLIIVFVESIIRSYPALLFFRKRGEICLPSWTEVDMPSPEATNQRLWILIVSLPHRALWAVMFLFHTYLSSLG